MTGLIAPAFAVLTALWGSAAGAVDAWMVPGRVTAAVGAAELAVVVAGVYGFMSRWLHPVGAAAWSSWLLLGAVLLGWGAVFLASLDVSPMTSGLLWAASALSAVTLPSAVVQTRELVSDYRLDDEYGADHDQGDAYEMAARAYTRAEPTGWHRAAANR